MSQAGRVGIAATSLPAVTVTDVSGNPVPNVPVTSQATAGGGTVTGGSPSTDALGQATVGGWTFGRTVTTNTVTATVGALPLVTFDATVEFKVASVASGLDHTCALTIDGVAYCWGANGTGGVGDSSKTQRNSPAGVATSLLFSQIAGGSISSSRSAPKRCAPVFLGPARKLHLAAADPASPDPSIPREEMLRRFRAARDQIDARLAVLESLLDLPEGPSLREFHASIRVSELGRTARFYAWLLGIEPKEWTHRYVTFVSEKLALNLVFLVSDGKTLGKDTLYHLGIDVGDKASVVRAHTLALALGATITKPPRTTCPPFPSWSPARNSRREMRFCRARPASASSSDRP